MISPPSESPRRPAPVNLPLSLSPDSPLPPSSPSSSFLEERTVRTVAPCHEPGWPDILWLKEPSYPFSRPNRTQNLKFNPAEKIAFVVLHFQFKIFKAKPIFWSQTVLERVIIVKYGSDRAHLATLPPCKNRQDRGTGLV